MLRRQKSEEKPTENEVKVCSFFKNYLYSFIGKLDKLLKDKELGRDVGFLEEVANSVVTIHNQACEAEACGEEVRMAAALVHNFLTHPIDIQGVDGQVTLIESAQGYLKDKTPSCNFCRVMVSCVYYSDETKVLISSLRLIAYEL